MSNIYIITVLKSGDLRAYKTLTRLCKHHKGLVPQTIRQSYHKNKTDTYYSEDFKIVRLELR